MDMVIQARLDELRSTVQGIDDPKASVATMLNNFPALVEQAMARARSLGATEAQLSAFDELNARLRTDAPALTEAVMSVRPFATAPQAPAQPAGVPAAPAPAPETQDGSQSAQTDAAPGVPQMAPNPDAGIQQQQGVQQS